MISFSSGKLRKNVLDYKVCLLFQRLKLKKLVKTSDELVIRCDILGQNNFQNKCLYIYIVFIITATTSNVDGTNMSSKTTDPN